MSGLWFVVYGSGLEFRVQGSGFRVQGSGRRLQRTSLGKRAVFGGREAEYGGGSAVCGVLRNEQGPSHISSFFIITYDLREEPRLLVGV